MIQIKNRRALVLLLVALSSASIGGVMLWKAYTDGAPYPPVVAFVAFAVAVVAVLIPSKRKSA